MSEYNFLRTGGNLIENENQDELIKDITSLVVYFTENALKIAAKYCHHSKRKIVSTKDLEKGMKCEVFFYLRRKNTEIDIENIKEILFEKEDNVAEDFEDLILDEDEEEEETGIVCECNLCKFIDNIEEKWEKYEPINDFEKILIKYINNINNKI